MLNDAETTGQKVKRIKEWTEKIKENIKVKRMVEKGDSGYGSKVFFLAFCLCSHCYVLLMKKL